MAVLAVVVHECAHGLVALWRGDSTARDCGRLTLNPLPHVHWLGSVVLPLVLLALGGHVLFGWAKPVPVNWANLRDPRNDAVQVALAGPAANLLLALGFSGLLAVTPEGGAWGALERMWALGVLVNCGLAVLNLLPIPPLDGSWLATRYLPRRHLYALVQFRLPGIALAVLLLMIPAVNYYLVQLPVLAVANGFLRLYGLEPERLLGLLA
jgi:Zn-dependent protease